MTPAAVMNRLILVWMILLSTTAISMVFLHIAKLRNSFKTMNLENAKMLDGMHEGVLILSK